MTIAIVGTWRSFWANTTPSTLRQSSGRPASIRRLTSYSPTAAKGAISGKPTTKGISHHSCPDAAATSPSISPPAT